MKSIEIHDFYPHPTRKRYGGILPEHAGIRTVLDENMSKYSERLEMFARYNKYFREIPLNRVNDVTPYWCNDFFPSLDIISLFGMIAEHRPVRYIEVGSGNSTKVAHYAKTCLSLGMKIISIDPQPRSEVDVLCNHNVRLPLQDCDSSLFNDLSEGDILFFDGSHRVLQNSDNQVLFFEIIPRLKPGVIIHIHDVNWPHDYPEEWTNRYYNEQYVLGAMLMYAPDLWDVLFPGAYITMKFPLVQYFGEIWERPGYKGVQRHGCSFWFRKARSNKAMEST